MITPIKMTFIQRIFLSAFFALALLSLGCDSGSKTPEKKDSQSESMQLETGRFALQKMLAPARFWAADAMPVRMESTNLKDTTGKDGKVVFWRAIFASASREKSETFTWSGTATDDGPRGVNHGAEDSYNPANRTARIFDLNYLKTDTDKAFEVAQAHGGKQITEKDPKASVGYLLDFDAQANQLRWHVIYGGNDVNSKLTVLVDASNGEFLRKQ